MTEKSDYFRFLIKYIQKMRSYRLFGNCISNYRSKTATGGARANSVFGGMNNTVRVAELWSISWKDQNSEIIKIAISWDIQRRLFFGNFQIFGGSWLAEKKMLKSSFWPRKWNRRVKSHQKYFWNFRKSLKIGIEG